MRHPTPSRNSYSNTAHAATSVRLAQYRLEDDWDIDPTQVDPHYLDLIRYRDVSNYIAERLSVYHESPQVILVKDGECTYEESHMGIYVAEIKEQLV